jgi:hypothetical protein
MKKRAAAGVLWFYAGWYAWAMVASLVGLPGALGPIVGAGLGAFVALDPIGRVWRSSIGDAASPAGAPEPQGAFRS